jgi:hypothetical protein
MPKREPDLKQFAAAIALMLATFIAYRVGIFDALGRLLVNHATTSMQREGERQQQQRQAKTK